MTALRTRYVMAEWPAEVSRRDENRLARFVADRRRAELRIARGA